MATRVRETESQWAEGLYSAVVANDTATLSQLLARGANPDTVYRDRFTCNSKSILHIACGKGYTDCVRILLKAGAMVDIHDKWGQMPLHYCLCSEFLDTASALLDHLGGEQAADIVNRKLGVQQRSCLLTMATKGSLDGVRRLLGYGAKVNDVDYTGTSPLMACLGSSNWGEDLMAVVKMLVEVGTDLEIKNNKGLTALQLAVMRQDAAAVDYLLRSGASLDTVDGRGRTPLVNAIIIGVPQGMCVEGRGRDLLEVLIQGGADLSGNTEQSSVLMACIDCRQWSAPPLLRFFLQRGADPDVLVGEETTPLLHAIRRGDGESVKVLLEHTCSLQTVGQVYRPGATPCRVDPIDLAVTHGNMNILRFIIAAGLHLPSHSRKAELVLEEVARQYAEHQLSAGELQWFEDCLCSPPSLLCLAVCNLRAYLGSRLHWLVTLLPLPSAVKKVLLTAHRDE